MGIKWTDDKINLLLDGYEYRELDDLASEIGTTVKAIKRKAERLKLRRGKNNAIVDGHKFCTFCKGYHPIDEFYRNKSKHDGYEYICKKYWKLKNIKQDLYSPTVELNKKR